MLDEELELEQEAEAPDIEFIMQAVEAAGLEGIAPEQILDERELETYLSMQEEEQERKIGGHYDNLVGIIDDTQLGVLASDICNWVTWDEETRADWSKRESEGIRMLGVSDKVSGGAPFKGASTVVHPLLSEAVVQFHARALTEMWPPEGPVKSIVLGNKDPERMQQAERVQDYMNYQYTEDMPGAFEEEDNLLFRLPLSGSCFKKLYFDPIANKLCSRLIEPADFIVPFSATDLETAPRYTHRYREMHNTVLKKVEAGYYARTQKLTKPNNELAQYPQVKREIDQTEGRQGVGVDDANRHTILEMYVDLELKGQEDIGKDGKPTGIALPYIVWVNRDDQEILRIQRNWKPNDKHKNSKVNVVHYRFMPGLGFYGYGLLHLIGGLANSATGALRALLDTAAFANMPGGYRTRDSRIKGGDTVISPGEWREVDSSAEELSKAFFQLPYQEPSQTLFHLLGYLDERGQKFVGTTDVMTGDANPNAPVGTTLAMIEQGGKTFNAIHRRMHVAHRNEFRILARLNSEHLPEEGYPYYTNSGERMIMPTDFDERVDIIPVSDPSIISNTQRIVQAQAVLDLATKYPGKVDIDAALKMMLTVIRVPNVDELLKVDEAMQQQQQKVGEMEIQIKQAELDKIGAEIKLIEAQTVKAHADKAGINVKTQYEAVQTGVSVMMNPGVLPVSDDLLGSAGYEDQNGSPVADPVSAQAMQQPIDDVQQSEVPQNTSPQFPPNPPQPEQVDMQQPDMMEQVPMDSPMQGIETQENDGVMQ